MNHFGHLIAAITLHEKNRQTMIYNFQNHLNALAILRYTALIDSAG